MGVSVSVPPASPSSSPRPPLRMTSPAGGRLPEASSAFTQQRERLILELLPFKDANKFYAWLGSGPVQGSWDEFRRDLLARVPADQPDPDKGRTAQAAKDAVHARSQKFLVYHPDKGGWSPEDHYVRFIVTVVLDSLLSNLWSDNEWKKKGVDICKAIYEVLFFLKASHDMNSQAPPRYSD